MKINLERSKFKELQKVDIGIVIHTFVNLTSQTLIIGQSYLQNQVKNKSVLTF